MDKLITNDNVIPAQAGIQMLQTIVDRLSSSNNTARQIGSGYKSRRPGFSASIVFNFHASFLFSMAFSRSIADSIISCF
ncbi:MAG: hypothetical protein ABW152_12360 [Candidatus Thiodiazotropha endolucinida]